MLITINNQPLTAREGQSLIEIARENHITIPTLCYHKDLSTVGSCRLCVVEVEGAKTPQAACGVIVREGMKVRTESDELTRARKTILELLLTNYSDADFTADTEFLKWCRLYGATRPEGSLTRVQHKVNSDPNPFVWVDFNKCILCTRCVRACAEVQGRFVWRTSERGASTQIAAGFGTTMLEARCESCGACVAYCPTGALDNKMSMEAGTPDKVVTTTCTYCGVGCQFDLNVKDNKIIRVTSNPNAPVNGMHLCVKGRYGYDFVHHPDRLTKPRVREYLLQGKQRKEGNKERGKQGNKETGKEGKRGKWIEVDWETALNITAKKLKEARDQFGADSVGVLTSAKCLNEENYLMQKFARQVIGTNNVDHCARL